MFEEKTLGKRKVRVFSERPITINDMLDASVSKFPANEAVVSENIRISYSELASKVDNIAANLQKNYGIKKGDRVALLLNNCSEFVLSVFAAAKLGAIVVPLNTRLQEEELTYMFNNACPSILILEEDYLKKIDSIQHRDGAHQLNHLFVVINKESERKSQNNVHNFSTLKMNNTLDELPDLAEEDPLFILYTSGTTGLPKGAVLSHIGVVHGAMNFNYVLNTDEHTRSLIAIPLFHVSGLIAQLMHVTYTGGTSVLIPRFQTENFIEHLNKEKITFTFNVPTIYTMILSSGLLKDHGYPFVKSLSYGGAPMPTDTINQLKKHFINANLQNAYGATETSSPAVIMPIEHSIDKLHSIGHAVPVGELIIVNENLETCAPNEIGELLIKGPMVIQKYWENEQANIDSFYNDYWISGDIAKIDEEGYVYLLDRQKEMINRGGEKVYSAEVENVIYNFPGILEAAVVGVPDPLYGESVKAFIVPKENETIKEEDLIAYMHKKLARYKVPKDISYIDELPRNPSGKVLKRSLVQ